MRSVAAIRLIVLDIDGVLTDGRVLLGSRGGEWKFVWYPDLDALSDARRSGVRLALVSAEDSRWARNIARRLAVPRVKLGVKDKLRAIQEIASEEGVPLECVCYVADADRDVPALRAVGVGVAPANATESARVAADRVLKARGGGGALCELFSWLSGRGGGDARARKTPGRRRLRPSRPS